ATGKRARCVDEIRNAFGFTARGEQLVHYSGRVGLRERSQLEPRMATATVSRPVVAPCDHLRPRKTEDEDGRVERVEEVREEVERLVFGVVQIVEDENDRAATVQRPLRPRVPSGVGRGVRIRVALALRAVPRVGFDEALDDSVAQRAHLARVTAYRLDERRV